jgi:hypothetical protein
MRVDLTSQPGLAEGLVHPPPPALLGPLVSPPLAREQAAGLDLILEGFLLHHGRPRHLTLAERGERVLAGDYCYAHGLVRVAAAGDLFVIEALSDLIALGAGLVAAGDREALADLWRATAAAIAAGDGAARDRAATALLDGKRRLRVDGDAAALAELGASLAPTPELAGLFFR